VSDDIWATDRGVYCGFGVDRTEGTPSISQNELRYVGDRHIATIGPNGSGKSMRLLLPNLSELTGWSIVVIDPKGELAYRMLKTGHREKANNRQLIINPFDAFGLGSHGFNPIAALDPGSPSFVDNAMLQAVSIIQPGEKEPHWGESGQDLLAALIMYSRLSQTPAEDAPKDKDQEVVPPGSYRHVRRMLGKSAAEFAKFAKEMVELGRAKGCESLVVKAARFQDMGTESRELNSILSTVLTQTRWLDSDYITDDLDGFPVKRDADGNVVYEPNGLPTRDRKQNLPQFDFSTLKTTPTTVYLTLPANYLSTHATWLRLMIAAALQPMLRDTREARVPVLLMVDEFAQLGHLPIVERNLAIMRGYGVKLWVVLQDLSQLQELYPQRWESFLGNAGVLNSFAPQDVMTAEYLSKRTGQTTKAILAYSQSAGGQQPGMGDTLNLNQTALPLMMPQDLRNMDTGYGVLFSHKTKGTVRFFAPWPRELKGMEAIMAANPPAV
jgi:type IV secretion system protein VirD4